MSFLQKLKGKGAVSLGGEKLSAQEEEKISAGAIQLDVDIYQTDSEIVIYAPVAGANVEEIDVSIEGDNDVITIKGKRIRPEEDARSKKDGKYFLEECRWGDFFRQIILPEQIKSSNAEAKVKNGVLTLKFPLHSADEKKIKMKVVRIDEHH